MQKTILISGASSGIGRATALRLARDGYKVLAGVRTQDAANELLATVPQNLEPVFLDITDEASLDTFFLSYAPMFEESGLYGVVNNAGTVQAGAFEFTPVTIWKQQFDVNFFGHVSVTHRAVPYVRRARGRVIFISTLGGQVGYPMAGPYCASKFALEGAADSLRRELHPFGAKVSVVEPGGTATRMLDALVAAADEAVARVTGDGADTYRRVGSGFSTAAKQFQGMATDPEKVVDAICHALFSQRPKIRYRVGPDAKLLLSLKAVVPDRVMDFILRKAMKL